MLRGLGLRAALGSVCAAPLLQRRTVVLGAALRPFAGGRMPLPAAHMRELSLDSLKEQFPKDSPPGEFLRAMDPSDFVTFASRYKTVRNAFVGAHALPLIAALVVKASTEA